MNHSVNSIRALLINVGKALPFVLCFIVLISYTETLFALLTSDFLVYNGSLIPNKPVSWFLGEFFEYNLQLLIVVTIITFAIRTCIYNKLATLYLFVNLLEKDLFTFEMDVETIYLIVIFNIMISTVLVLKGLKLLMPLFRKVA